MQLKIRRRFSAYSYILQKRLVEEIKKVTQGPRIVVKEKKDFDQDYDDLALTLNRDQGPKKLLH